ncbi:MAG TPA: hypothetical protein VG452_02270 [Egibacteraceae bacterium]|nr:hypothetical protein [Egibacteraceae bacterium]
MDAEPTSRRHGRAWRAASTEAAVAPPTSDHPVGLGEDSGPQPVLRAVWGILLGLAAGAVATVFITRPATDERASPAAG